MNSHLVTVEVGVERSTSQRVQLNSFTLDKLGLESLDTQTVQCRSTVEQYRMAFHHVLKDIPDNGLATVNNLLGALHRLHDATLNQLANDERLIQLGSHQLRQTTLAHLQFRTYNDNRTC